MDLFNTIENKVRFYGMKIGLMCYKYETILRMCLRGLAFYTFLLSVLLCFVFMSFSNGLLDALFDTIRNICYSYIAGYIFYIVSDVYPKTTNRLKEMPDIISHEICILHNANSVLDTTIKYSVYPNYGTDKLKNFIANSAKVNPYTNDNKQVELNDIFLRHLYFIQNEIRTSFYILLKSKSHLLEYNEIIALLELKDFMFLNEFNGQDSIYLAQFEMEYYNYIANIHKLEKFIKKQMKSYVYNPCDYERLENELKKTNEFGLKNFNAIKL